MNIYQGMRTADGTIVTCNGRILEIDLSKKLCNHGAKSFGWGANSPEAAQLALAVLLHEIPVHAALVLHRDFETEIIAELPRDWFQLQQNWIAEWLVKHNFGMPKAETNAIDLGIEFMLIDEDGPIPETGKIEDPRSQLPGAL